MKKTINLFFDFEFTSLSPDSQPISLGIAVEVPKLLGEPKYKYIPAGTTGNSVAFHNWYDDKMKGIDVVLREDDYSKEEAFKYFMSEVPKTTKTFYSEFSDFDINRCDDWVKENVVKKLRFNDWADTDSIFSNFDNLTLKSNTEGVIESLLFWLKKQFKDYDIQFIGDCVTWDWYHLLQLIGDWKSLNKGQSITGVCPTCRSNDAALLLRTGLPKLPSNISPVPQDLNDLIALKKGISIREAFDLNREELAYGHKSEGIYNRTKDLDSATTNALGRNPIEGDKHNSLWDAKVIKDIFKQLQE